METTNSGRHLYSRRWLGLIPLIGAFVGFHFILLGLITYRDRKLVFIGLASIAWTVFLYASLYYVSNYGKIGRDLNTQEAQMNLNGLLSDIEFYNLQNGHYPEDLRQVENNNKLVSIWDPFSAKQFGDRKMFNYQRDDKHYSLFSVGPDMIPNTEDDIYPSVDTKRTGWIKTLVTQNNSR